MGFRSEKEKTALFVDLTNFYSQLIKSKLDSPQNLRSYFTEWFDFSALSSMLTYEATDVWVFYSGEKLGNKDSRIDKQYMKDLIKRLNKQKGVTCYDVNIPGEQREPQTSKCQSCGNETDIFWKSEKGIDSSLIVHLFDTMESWDKAYLLSGDADFVPAVNSLRRRGKVVNGAGFTANASSALIRECFDYVNLEDFISLDLINKSIFGENGLISKFFVKSIPKSITKLGNTSNFAYEIQLNIYLSYEFEWEKMHLTLNSPEITDSELKTSLLELFDIDKFSDDHAEENYDAYLDYYFKDHLIAHLKLIADKLQLESDISDNHRGFVYRYYLPLVWNEKNKIYERYAK
jgi:uncharacterized LabA/DUF88 family protein